jgi:hypothetical protein
MTCTSERDASHVGAFRGRRIPPCGKATAIRKPLAASVRLRATCAIHAPSGRSRGRRSQRRPTRCSTAVHAPIDYPRPRVPRRTVIRHRRPGEVQSPPTCFGGAPAGPRARGRCSTGTETFGRRSALMSRLRRTAPLYPCCPRGLGIRPARTADRRGASRAAPRPRLQKGAAGQPTASAISPAHTERRRPSINGWEHTGLSRRARPYAILGRTHCTERVSSPLQHQQPLSGARSHVLSLARYADVGADAIRYVTVSGQHAS